MRLTKFEIVSLVIGILCILISITTFIVFPITYPKMVKKNLQLTQNSDTSLGFSAFMMANPPIINVMKFYFFNITNQDEMVYEGAKPRVVETNAYAVM
ncbi:hypothetical protein OESDEN_20568 [Oesophagostomum dentatum]|uniref:Uncharacterized protein n=1 Tax=Oesophagostomum dentatum TaxID=61180 RepID=A0A0B1S983_OESDE|nr:hypothetical protein OESDEN_20568 [Oesophagostomum dentatum]